MMRDELSSGTSYLSKTTKEEAQGEGRNFRDESLGLSREESRGMVERGLQWIEWFTISLIELQLKNPTSSFSSHL